MNDLEIFVITNGRKTLQYTLDALYSQSEYRKITIISDMLWVDALRKCYEMSESKYYLRVDDDMFLHKNAVAYYLHNLKKMKNVGVYECKFWEDWSNKPAGSLKAYKTSVVRRIDFRPNHLGKVDKPFAADLQKTKYKRIKDKSMIGLHACADVDDQRKYRSLWRDKNSSITPQKFSKTFDNIIHKFDLSIESQYKRLRRIPKINKKYKTEFAKFMRELK